MSERLTTKHQFLGLDAQGWREGDACASGLPAWSPMTQSSVGPDDVRLAIVAMLERLDETGDGYEQIGWMDPFGEVHSDRTHADCDPEPPCIAVYRQAD